MQCAKFFAAPRSIEGPPTSIISTASASVTPWRAATCSNGIEVHAHEVERLDPVLLERRDVFGVVTAREDAGVNARVERLHAAAEHLRRVGERVDVLDR